MGEDSDSVSRAVVGMAAGRGAAFFLAVFTLVNLAGGWWSPGFDANIWWIDLRGLPAPAADLFLLAGVAALFVAAGGFRLGRVTRMSVRIVIAGLLACVIFNAVMFYVLLARGVIEPGVRVPLSLALAVVLGVILAGTFRRPVRTGAVNRIVFLGTCAGCLVIFPWAQMVCFGRTDYRRHADAIVVFGALTYKDGTPSQALADRVNTAIALYKSGVAPVLIFSGGPSKGPVSEPEAMRNLALSQGVPASAIVLDEGGFHTDASVTDTVGIFKARGFHSIIAVSHFYHLPRIKMAYERALAKRGGGIEVVTVPAAESAPLVRMPAYMAREVAAWWAYYLDPLVGRLG